MKIVNMTVIKAQQAGRVLSINNNTVTFAGEDVFLAEVELDRSVFVSDYYDTFIRSNRIHDVDWAMFCHRWEE